MSSIKRFLMLAVFAIVAIMSSACTDNGHHNFINPDNGAATTAYSYADCLLNAGSDTSAIATCAGLR